MKPAPNTYLPFGPGQAAGMPASRRQSGSWPLLLDASSIRR